MTEPALKTLQSKLCPWLRPALERLESAHAARRLGHAWLIAGPPGVGKLNLALVFARRLLERRRTGDELPDLAPPDAVAALRDRHAPADHHPDLHWLFPEEGKTAVSVEQVRDAAAALNLKAHAGGSKVVLLEQADGMTTAAANALLKTLEEPSADTYLLPTESAARNHPEPLSAPPRRQADAGDDRRLDRSRAGTIRGGLGSHGRIAHADRRIDRWRQNK
jgi:hypothetical protein